MDLFDRLRREELLRDSELFEASMRASTRGEDLASAVWAMGLLPERTLVRVLAIQSGYPGVELGRSVVPLENLSLVPKEAMREKRVLPVVDTLDGLVLAMAEPHDDALADELAFLSGRKVLRHVALPAALSEAIEACLALADSGGGPFRGALAAGLDTPVEGCAAIVNPGEGEGDGSAPTPGRSLPFVLGARSGPAELFDPRLAGFEFASPRAGSGALPGRGKLALVVDDDPDLRALEVKLVESLGCAVVESGDGKQALALARERLPDVVILDGMLPGMHGFEVCRAIKGDPLTRSVKVVMVSGIHTGWKIAIDVREVYGADHFFEKPFRVDELSRAIRGCLSGSDAESEAALARRREALALCQKAAARAQADELEEAISLLRAAATKDPFSAEPHFLLGQALRQAGDAYRAIAAFERARELRPDLEQPLSYLAELYAELGFRRTAEEILRKAVEATEDPSRRAALEARLCAVSGAAGG